MVCFIKTNHYNVTIGLYGNHSHFTTTPTPASPPPPLPLHHHPHSHPPTPNPHHYTNYTFCPIALHSGGITGTKRQVAASSTCDWMEATQGAELESDSNSEASAEHAELSHKRYAPRPSQLHPLKLGVLVLLALSPRSSLIPILTFQWHFWGTRS